MTTPANTHFIILRLQIPNVSPLPDPLPFRRIQKGVFPLTDYTFLQTVTVTKTYAEKPFDLYFDEYCYTSDLAYWKAHYNLP